MLISLRQSPDFSLPSVINVFPNRGVLSRIISKQDPLRTITLSVIHSFQRRYSRGTRNSSLYLISGADHMNQTITHIYLKMFVSPEETKAMNQAPHICMSSLETYAWRKTKNTSCKNFQHQAITHPLLALIIFLKKLSK